MDRHRQTPWHALKLTEVYETLHTSEEGLGDAEAAERLEKHGRNELRSKPPKTILQMLKAQIVDPMVLILIGAAAFSAILQEWTEAAVIFIIVIVNAVIFPETTQGGSHRCRPPIQRKCEVNGYDRVL